MTPAALHIILLLRCHSNELEAVAINNIVLSKEFGVFLQRGSPRSQQAENNVL